jgi:hypothetical protein
MEMEQCVDWRSLPSRIKRVAGFQAGQLAGVCQRAENRSRARRNPPQRHSRPALWGERMGEASRAYTRIGKYATRSRPFGTNGVACRTRARPKGGRSLWRPRLFSMECRLTPKTPDPGSAGGTLPRGVRAAAARLKTDRSNHEPGAYAARLEECRRSAAGRRGRWPDYRGLTLPG